MLIFVIDDEQPLLNSAKRIIGKAAPEADIVTYNDALEAIKDITEKGKKPDVVFSDIEMPGISGLDLAVRLKTLSPETRVVFVTGYLKYAVDAFKVHAQGYIMKPLSVEDVLDELTAIPKKAVIP
ncbi:MAG: response regulator [Lachnospiraceae bacterium]|nr:response regulator [Lachnospiraceae bacterium]